jgi:hypothetical protein
MVRRDRRTRPAAHAARPTGLQTDPERLAAGLRRSAASATVADYRKRPTWARADHCVRHHQRKRATHMLQDISMKYTLAGCLALAALPIQAQSIDCQAASSTAGTEPAGFAEACLGVATKASSHAILAAGAGDEQTGYAVQINPTEGFAPLGLYQFGLDNFAGATRLGTLEETARIYGLDFNPAGTRLYGSQYLSSDAGSRLGTFNLGTGAFSTTSLFLTLPLSETMTGMAIDPRKGDGWIITNDILTNNPQLSETRLWRMDTGNAATVSSTRILADQPNPVFADIAMNCEGEMYGHNLTDDSLYKIDPDTGEATLLGPHGLAANFAQGIAFDHASGELYGSIYTGGGANTFGTFNLETGAFTGIEAGASGQWKIAFRNQCSPKIIEPETIEGAWYASYTSGQGFIARYYEESDILFMPWFTYSLEGGEEVEEQRWYTLFGTVGDDMTEIELPILQTIGGNFDALPTVNAVQVGTARLSFYSCSEGVLEYDFDESHNGGVDGRITMTRLINSGTDCTQFDGSVVEAETAYEPTITGSWYDPENAGQGVELFYVKAVDADPDQGIEPVFRFMYGGWFTFEPAPAANDPSGQRWFTFSGVQVDEEDGTLTSTIVRTVGGSFDNELTRDSTNVGSVVFESEGCDRLKMTYEFNDQESVGEFRDKSGEINLRRLGACPSSD